jgi:hypothetical protein
MVTAAALVVGMGINALRYKNVNINPDSKHNIIVPDSGKRTTVTEILARYPTNRRVEHEGIGVDHEEWTKNKEQQSK